MPSSNATAEQLELVLEIDRVFDAPRELVWRLWADPEHMVRWYGPEGFALIACESDFRVGGAWRRCMSRGPGHAHWISGSYLEIEAPSRLRFSYVNEYDGFASEVKLEFSATADGQTRMRFRQTPFANAAQCEGHGWGWNSSFELLARYVAQFIEPGDWRPIGVPRRDGVAEDIVQARLRQAAEKQVSAGGK